jgi:hypothetical protein
MSADKDNFIKMLASGIETDFIFSRKALGRKQLTGPTRAG